MRRSHSSTMIIQFSLLIAWYNVLVVVCMLGSMQWWWWWRFFLE